VQSQKTIIAALLIVSLSFNVYSAYANNISFPQTHDLKYDRSVVEKFASLYRYKVLTNTTGASIKNASDYTGLFNSNEIVDWPGTELKFAHDDFTAIPISTFTGLSINKLQEGINKERLIRSLRLSPFWRFATGYKKNFENVPLLQKQFVQKYNIQFLVIEGKESLPAVFNQDFVLYSEDSLSAHRFYLRRDMYAKASL
jgi:hypothetical protein